MIPEEAWRGEGEKIRKLEGGWILKRLADILDPPKESTDEQR